MNKSTSVAMVLLGLFSLHWGLQVSPVIALWVAPLTPLGDMRLAWLTVGIIAVIFGGFGIFYRPLR